jgi:hypothetical protein
MADFSQDKKYNYNWQSSKFKNLALSGSYISQFINDAGYVTSSVAVSASYALTASYLTGTIASASYATSASHALTASYFSGTVVSASYATNALSASYAPSSPAFPFTGSANITGSLTVVGSTTSTQIGAGAAPSGSIRLDVRAQGALSTDIAFRVRNSADTRDIINVRGNKTIELIADTPSTNGGISITTSAYNEPIINMYDSFSSKKLIIDTSNALIGVGGSGNIKIGSLTTANSYLGLVTPTTNNRFLKLVDAFDNEYLSLGGNAYDGGGGISLTLKTTTNNGTNFVTFSKSNNTNKFIISDQANVGIGQETFGTSSKFVLAVANGTAPTTSPVDSFQQYSADIIAGNAAPHFRTEAGNIVKLYTQPAVTSSQGIADALTNLGFLTGSSTIPGVSFGAFGVANSSGSYTYYTTFSASIAAATSGQTVEMFADVIETGSVTVTLKNGVNISGNGHTYTLNTSGGPNAFSLPSSATCFIFDAILRVLNSSGSLMVLGTNSTLRGNAILYGSGSTSSEYAVTTTSTIPANISGFTIITEGAKNGIFLGNGSFGDNLQIYSNTGIGLWIQDSAQVRNSNIYATNPSTRAVYVQGGLLYSMVYSGGANAGNAIHMQSGNNTTQPRGIYNCDVKSLTGHGVFMDNAMDLEDCKITTYGTNKNALTFDTNATTTYTDVHKCVLRSINGACVNQVLRWVSFTDCYLFAGAGSGITNSFNNSTFNVVRLRDSYVEVAHNSNTSHGALLSNSTLHEISDCYFSLANSGSYALKAQGSTTAKYLQNSFTGSAVPVDPNISQGMISTQDNFGNIII